VKSLKKSFKLITLFLSLLAISSGISFSAVSVRAYTPGHSVMILAANSVGDTYWPAKSKFESWGWTVTTAGLTASVTSCLNTNPRPVPVDILISDVNNDLLSQYECIFVPSGGHWSALLNNPTTLNLIYEAYNLGLIISSLCVGIRVIAGANILDGVRVAYDSNSAANVAAAGGITVNERVVTHRRIVTGTTGGGPTGGGASQAPTIEVCEAIADILVGQDLPLNIAVVAIAGGLLAGLILFFKRRERILNS
jgi:putative intracellular protease/amidase